MIDLATLALLGNAIGGPATLALVYLFWRLDRRLTRLETIVEWITKGRPQPCSGD